MYYFVSWAIVGKTPRMTLIGLRVVRRDGSKLGAGKAAIRTLVFPLSFILFGLGLWESSWADVAADTIVVDD